VCVCVWPGGPVGVMCVHGCECVCDVY
jgi:hypothetical protein